MTFILLFVAIVSNPALILGLRIPSVKCSRVFPTAINRANNNSPSKLAAYGDYDDENKGLSLKVLGILAVGIVGVFGTGLFNDLGSAMKSVEMESRASGGSSTLKKTEESRGSMTRLTRREINDKLRQVPVFYAEDLKTGGIYVSDGVGKLFAEKADVDELIRGKEGVKVDATTMDDVFYTLVERKSKLGSFVEGVVGKSDPTAQYILIPSAKQVSQTAAEWKSSHDNDIPLFRIANLAFEKADGLEIPLFLHREDALSSYSRLQDTKRESSTAAAGVLAPPTVQETSLKDLVKLFSSGGFEGRALEIYPSIESIEDAQSLILGEKRAQ
jgi:Tic22-like family